MQRQLLVNGQEAKLGARAFDVLLTLIGRRGQLVTKHELLDAVWPGLVVEENNLVVQVGTLRKLLGAEVIATIPGRGYRFTAAPEAPQGREPGPVDATAQSDRPLRSNLPEVLPALIGRDDDLVALGALLGTCRLVTLVGAGGIGKTRVAQRLLHGVRGADELGVAWVELAGLSNSALVVDSIASALGLQISSADPLKSLVTLLRQQRMLVALDNAEHLVDAVARVVQALMDGAPEVRLLVTSQVPLRLAEERVYRLGSLAVPASDTPRDEALGFGAVALFVERAQAVDRHFALTAETLACVIDICRQLDGLALAIELAAARVAMLGVKTLSAALDHRLQLLTTGRRGAPQRQQTLRAALEWTHGLLVAGEQKVFRRLGVFAGGFTLEMAREVAADAQPGTANGLDEWDVVEALSALVDRSLVAVDTAHAPRYRLLESPRAYALAKLAESGEAPALQRRHAQHMHRLYERAANDWLRVSDAVWSAQYAPEPDNLRMALDWAFESGGDVPLGLALSGASAMVWTEMSLYAEGLSRLGAAVARIETQTPQLDQSRLWSWLGVLQINGAPAEAARTFERAADSCRQVGDAAALASVLIRLARAYAGMGRTESAALVLAEAESVLPAEGSAKLQGRLADVRGFLSKMNGDPGASRRHYERALSLFRRAGADSLLLGILVNFADTAWMQGDLDAALSGFREAAAALRLSPATTKGRLGVCLTNLAGVHVERHELDAALAAARVGLPLRQEAGFAWGALDHLALRAALAGKLIQAAQITGYADAAFALKAATRQPNEARARTQLMTLLQDKLDPLELARLVAEGAGFDEDQACRLALLE